MNKLSMSTEEFSSGVKYWSMNLGISFSLLILRGSISGIIVVGVDLGLGII